MSDDSRNNRVHVPPRTRDSKIVGMNDKDLLRAYPTHAPYLEVLREIFAKPPEAFCERFPALTAAWEPFLTHLLDRDFDIDSLRKAANDVQGFQVWLLDCNDVLSKVPPSLIDEFVRDMRARFRRRTGQSMDRRAVLDVRQAIECFLMFRDRGS